MFISFERLSSIVVGSIIFPSRAKTKSKIGIVDNINDGRIIVRKLIIMQISNYMLQLANIDIWIANNIPNKTNIMISIIRV